MVDYFTLTLVKLFSNCNNVANILVLVEQPSHANIIIGFSTLAAMVCPQQTKKLTGDIAEEEKKDATGRDDAEFYDRNDATAFPARSRIPNFLHVTQIRSIWFERS
ncbi:hypothetical protein RUM43_011159 [Polyplax serrata]|uniref:Uncharacterized protein n=1 Tax=Polyplax serrata TaxID=468196 RepID=A0AAN8PUA7_POLSC